MWKSLFAAGLCATAAFGQNSQQDLANLMQDVRGLTLRVNELSLKLEQLERENADLRQRASAADKASYATVAQLREAIEEANRGLRATIESSRVETLQQVKTQIEKLGNATNAALESLAKGQAARTAPVIFTEDYPKEGIRYTVQKGDTLAVIAKKTGAKQQDIINANKLSDPSRITVGQTLFIPGAK